MTSGSSSRLPSADAAASRTSACSAPRSGVSRGNAGCAAFPRPPKRPCGDRPDVRRRIVQQGREPRNGRGRGRAVTLDELDRGEADLGARIVQLLDDRAERLAAPGTEGTQGIDRASLHPRVGIVEQRPDVADQAVIPWRRVREDVDDLDPDLRRSRRSAGHARPVRLRSARGPRSPIAARNAALTSRSGSDSPAASFWAVPGATGRICPSASAAPRRTRGSGAWIARASDSAAGRPIWASASAIGSMRLFGSRRASSSRGPPSAPVLESRNAAWRATPSFFAVRSDSSSGARRGSNARRPPSRSTTASRTRSSSCRRFSATIGSTTSSGSRQPRQRLQRRGPNLRRRVVRHTRRGSG